MNKKGFTLMELLFVIVIVALISISSVIVFGNIDDETSAKDRKNIYMDIQKSALLYIDLNDSWLEQFKANGEIKIELSELKNANYVSFDIKDPVTNKEIPSKYMVQIYTAYSDDDLEKYERPFIDTCIVNKNELLEVYCNPERKCEGGLTCNSINNCNCYNKEVCDKKSCVANSNGEKKNCCMKK